MMMSSRMAYTLLMLLYVLEVSASNKKKVDTFLTTTMSTGSLGNNFFVNMKKKKATKPKRTLCKLPHEIGPCRDAKQRFYYDLSTNECKFFTYGGCRGNRNNFPSLSKCEKTCKI